MLCLAIRLSVTEVDIVGHIHVWLCCAEQRDAALPRSTVFDIGLEPHGLNASVEHAHGFWHLRRSLHQRSATETRFGNV